MPDLILHHFDLSPFAEKIRMVLGYKGVQWTSVKIPMTLPKPDLVALTGGYRRTPVLQVGADIYCDTSLIARAIDAAVPARPIFPASQPLAPLLARWADWSLFWAVVDFAANPAAAAHRFRHLSPDQLNALVADRTPFRAAVPRQTPVDAQANLCSFLASLDAQLADGRAFLLGDASIADFSVAHCLWNLRRCGPVAEPLVDVVPSLRAWHDRMLAFGHGTSRQVTSAQALDLAAAAGGPAPAQVLPGSGFEVGQQVQVAALDYGTEPTRGTLVGLTPDEVVIARRDARAGLLHVHFPRIGYSLTAA